MAMIAGPAEIEPTPVVFARPQCNPHWTDLSSDVLAAIVRLVARLHKLSAFIEQNVGIAKEAQR